MTARARARRRIAREAAWRCPLARCAAAAQPHRPVERRRPPLRSRPVPDRRHCGPPSRRLQPQRRARRSAAAAGCVAPPAGIVAWWRAENDPTDAVGDDDGAPSRLAPRSRRASSHCVQLRWQLPVRRGLVRAEPPAQAPSPSKAGWTGGAPPTTCRHCRDGTTTPARTAPTSSGSTAASSSSSRRTTFAAARKRPGAAARRSLDPRRGDLRRRDHLDLCRWRRGWPRADDGGHGDHHAALHDRANRWRQRRAAELWMGRSTS